MRKFKLDTVVEIVKGGPGQEGELLMKGIASNSSKDSDGHNLNPRGFDVSYFLEKGFMNWNHEWKKNPLSIIGRPTKAFVNHKNELEIEYKLFKGHKTAEEVYQLAKILEENGSTLGLSIEGSVIETDPKNRNFITKAKITDCAVTPHPKNSGTVTSIIKANNLDDLVDFERMGTFEISPTGELLVKGIDTEDAEPIMPESVEGMEKKKKKKKKEGEEEEDDEEEEEITKGKKVLTKLQAIETVSKLNKNITLAMADAIYNKAIEFEKSISMNVQQPAPQEVSDEALNGALEQLGLIKSETPEKITEAVEAPEKREEVIKGNTFKELSEMTKEELSEYKAKLQKSLQDIEELEKPVKETKGESEELEKGFTGGSSELIKALSNSILQSEERMRESFNEKSQALGVLTSETIDLVKAFRDEFEKRLENLENEPQGSRAVLTKGYIPRPGTEFEKGGSSNGEVYSLSQQKSQLCTRLTDLAIEKAEGVEKIDSRLKADLIGLEAGSHLAPSVIEFAKANNIQIIQ